MHSFAVGSKFDLLNKFGQTIGVIEVISFDSQWIHGRLISSNIPDSVREIFLQHELAANEQRFVDVDKIEEEIQSLQLMAKLGVGKPIGLTAVQIMRQGKIVFRVESG